MGHTVVVVGQSDVIRGLAGRKHPVFHGNAQPREADHGQIIIPVPAGDHLLPLITCNLQKTLQGFCLVDPFWQNLQIVGV